MKIILSILFLMLPIVSNAADHYVRQGAAGSDDGSDWTNAWTTLPGTLTRGDTYYIADGSYAAYAFNDAASGTTLITIDKATVASHGTETGWVSTYGDGQAAFSGDLAFLTDDWLFDGKAWHGFRLDMDSNYGVGVTGDDVTIKYLHLVGLFDQGWGHSLRTEAENTELYYVDFDGTTFEDDVDINGVSGGTFVIDHCRFDHTGHPSDSAHRDLMNPYINVSGWNLTFTNNIVAGEFQDVLLFQNGYTGGGKLGVITIVGNVFVGGEGETRRAYGFGSTALGCTTLYDENNVYWDTWDDLNSGTAWDTRVTRNNIYGTDVSEGGSDAQYSAWMSGADGYNVNTGNFDNSVPLFINSALPDGADGIPFTADDGFNIQEGSDLINAGITITPSRTVDILGNAVSSPPGIGPYEYQTGYGDIEDAGTGSIVSGGTGGITD